MGIEYGENNNNVYDTCIFASENRLYPQNGHLNDKLMIKQKKKRLTVHDFQTKQNLHWFFYLVSVWKFPGHFSIEHPVVLGNPLSMKHPLLVACPFRGSREIRRPPWHCE